LCDLPRSSLAVELLLKRRPLPRGSGISASERLMP
jgi:hypothetical protein